MEKKNFGYYICNAKGVAIQWVEDAYTAARIASAKAKTFQKTYYVFNPKTNDHKAYTGYAAYMGYNHYGR